MPGQRIRSYGCWSSLYSGCSMALTFSWLPLRFEAISTKPASSLLFISCQLMDGLGTFHTHVLIGILRRQDLERRQQALVLLSCGAVDQCIDRGKTHPGILVVLSG